MATKKKKSKKLPHAPHEGRNLTGKTAESDKAAARAAESDKAAARAVEAGKAAAKTAESGKAAAAAAEAARIAAKAAAAKTAAPDRLQWILNGARWEATSLKAAGRTYTAAHVEGRGWTGGYNGQKASCPAAGVFARLASLARAACQAVEDAIDGMKP